MKWMKMHSLQYSLFLPKSNWIAPMGFPEGLLSSTEPVAIDTETFDPLLTTKGPSWRYREGHVVGICLATKDSQWYYPIRHFAGGNLPEKQVIKFFQDLLNDPNRVVYMANASYDVGWLWYTGILGNDIKYWPKIQDIILNEALLCEEHPMGYSLDAISHRRLGRHKDETLLREASREFGIDPKKDLWKLPANMVGPYGEGDARNTFDCAIEQAIHIEKEDLSRVHKLESSLISVFHAMTRNGIFMDTDKAAILNQKLKNREHLLQTELQIDVWSTDDCVKALELQNFVIHKTEKGNPSITKSFLNSIAVFKDEKPRNLPAGILELRKINRLRSVYIESAMEWTQHGYLYPEFLQMATDEGGARSGRVASKNPNFQQIPSRDEIGKEIRSLYCIEDDNSLWGKFDYNSQEPRWQVHYGIQCGYDGAEEAKKSFLAGKKLYSFMEENVPGLSYSDAKMLVLAKSYGMGVQSLADNVNMSRDQAQELINSFDKLVPYIGMLAARTKAVAEKKGFLKTILGRKRRFIFWEKERNGPTVFGYANAKKRWPNANIQRAFTHKAFNALIQGTSADQTKMAMLNIWQQTGKIPLSQVHDELNYEVSSENEAMAIQCLMETAIPNTLCPFKVDYDLGKSWK